MVSGGGAPGPQGAVLRGLALPLVSTIRRLFLKRGCLWVPPPLPALMLQTPPTDGFPDCKKGDPKHGKRKRGRPRKMSKESRECLEGKKSKHGGLPSGGNLGGGRPCGRLLLLFLLPSLRSSALLLAAGSLLGLCAGQGCMGVVTPNSESARWSWSKSEVC